MLRLSAFDYVCEPAGHRFRAPARVVGDAGVLLLRSAVPGSLAALTADDPLADELSAVIDDVLGDLQVSEGDRGTIFRRLVGSVCDPDEDGSAFEVGRPPTCPIGGETRMADWPEADPPAVDEVDVGPVRHRRWDAMGAEARRALVRDRLRADGFLER